MLCHLIFTCIWKKSVFDSALRIVNFATHQWGDEFTGCQIWDVNNNLFELTYESSAEHNLE